MKVKRKGYGAFEPITITLKTKEDAIAMQTIAMIKRNETLEECCEREKQDLSKVDGFGRDLFQALEKFLDY